MDTKSLVESLLFVADHPTTVEDLATVLQVNTEDVELALEKIALGCGLPVRGR